MWNDFTLGMMSNRFLSWIGAAVRRNHTAARLLSVLSVVLLVTAVFSSAASWWVRHGWIELRPLCWYSPVLDWGFSSYYIIEAPLKPEVWQNFVEIETWAFEQDVRLEGDRLMARPYAQYFDMPGKMQWTGHAVERFSDFGSSSICYYAVKYLTVDGLNEDDWFRTGQLKGFPPTHVLDILEFLTFHP